MPLIIVAIGFVGCATPSPGTAPERVPQLTTLRLHAVESVTAGRFDSSIGVVTHIPYPMSGYTKSHRVQTALAWLGIHNIRDALPGQPPASTVAEWKTLGASGIRIDLILGSAGVQAGGALIPPSQELHTIDSTGLRRFVDAVEGPNEWDLRGGSGWAAADNSYMSHVEQLIRSDHKTSAIRVVNPSVGRAGDAQELTTSGGARTNNLHAYPAGRPISSQTLDNYDAAPGDSRPPGPTWVTETGYHTAGSGSQPSVTPIRESDLMLPLLAENIADGIQRTYIYELLDQPQLGTASQEAHFGLLNSNFTPKPAGVAVHRLTSLLAANGPRVDPDERTALQSVTTNGSSPVHDLLVTGHGGLQTLLLWRPDGATRAAPTDVTVAFHNSTTVRVFSPSRSSHALWTGRTRKVSGRLGDDLIALRFNGNSGHQPTAQDIAQAPPSKVSAPTPVTIAKAIAGVAVPNRFR